MVYIVSVLVQTLVHIHTPFGGRHQHIEWPLYFWIISWVCKKLWYPQQFDSSISLLIFSLEISFHDLFLLALFLVLQKNNTRNHPKTVRIWSSSLRMTRYTFSCLNRSNIEQTTRLRKARALLWSYLSCKVLERIKEEKIHIFEKIFLFLFSPN